VKVAAAGERAAVGLQAKLLQHIALADPGLPVPRVVSTVGGDEALTAQVEGRDVLVRLVTWLPGRCFTDTVARSRELLADLGSVAGRLGAAASTLTGCGVPEPHYWDIAKSGEALADCLPFVTDDRLRRALERMRSWLSAENARLSVLPLAVVHGQCHLAYVDHAAAVVNLAIVMVGG